MQSYSFLWCFHIRIVLIYSSSSLLKLFIFFSPVYILYLDCSNRRISPYVESMKDYLVF